MSFYHMPNIVYYFKRTDIAEHIVKKIKPEKVLKTTY